MGTHLGGDAARHAAKQPRVSGAKLERLRLPKNRQESLRYGTEEQVVCLNCGRVGENIGHHLHGCPETPERPGLYKERWGFDRTKPLTWLDQGSGTSYQKEYYRQHSAELKDRTKKWHAASQPRVSGEELERLRIPENLLESLRYGPDEKAICLECGRIGDNLSRHTRGCPAKPQSSSAYKQRWGYDRSNPLTARKQREAYSQSQRQSPTFERRRESARNQLSAARAARTGARRGPMSLESKLRRRGKRTGARPHRQRIPDAEVLEILALNLSIAESAKRSGLSQTAFYRRSQRLGWNAQPAKEQRNRILERVLELRTWLFSQPEIPALDEIMRRYTNELRLGGLQHSPDLTSFISLLEAELRARPEAIGELAAGKGKLASSALTLASRIFKRAREPKRIAASKHAGRPKGMTKDRIEEGRKLEALIEKHEGKRGAVKEAAMEVYLELRADLAYDRARQTRKDYGRWKATNREKN